MEFDKQVIIARTNHMINSKRFFEASSLFINHQIDIFTNYNYIVKIMSDESRYLITLKQTSLLLTPSTELDRTAQSLYNFAIENKLGTKSRVAAGLAIAVLGHYVAWQTSPKDKRLKVFSPLPKFLHLARDSHNTYASALLCIDPKRYHLLSNYSNRMAGEMAGGIVEVFLKGRRAAEAISGLDTFSYRDGGFEILLRIMQEARFFSDNRRKSFALPFHSVANQFGISRSQSQKTFAAAEELGLIRLAEKGGKMIYLLPAFDPFATEVMANMLAVSSIAYDLVVEKMEQQGRADWNDPTDQW